MESDIERHVGATGRKTATSDVSPKGNYACLEPQTTIYKWMFQLDDSKSLYRKWLFHQTSSYKWLFGVPGGNIGSRNSDGNIALAILGLKGYFQHTETGTHPLYKPLPTGNKKGFLS